MNAKKIAAIIGVAIVVANLVLLGMQKISPLTFWLVIGLAALIAFVLMPRLK